MSETQHPFVPGAFVLPCNEDLAIFLKLKARGLWPIDNDFCDFAKTRADLLSGDGIREGAIAFDVYQQVKESLRG